MQEGGTVCTTGNVSVNGEVFMCMSTQNERKNKTSATPLCPTSSLRQQMTQNPPKTNSPSLSEKQTQPTHPFLFENGSIHANLESSTISEHSELDCFDQITAPTLTEIHVWTYLHLIYLCSVAFFWRLVSSRKKKKNSLQFPISNQGVCRDPPWSGQS